MQSDDTLKSAPDESELEGSPLGRHRRIGISGYALQGKLEAPTFGFPNPVTYRHLT